MVPLATNVLFPCLPLSRLYEKIKRIKVNRTQIAAKNESKGLCSFFSVCVGVYAIQQGITPTSPSPSSLFHSFCMCICVIIHRHTYIHFLSASLYTVPHTERYYIIRRHPYVPTIIIIIIEHWMRFKIVIIFFKHTLLTSKTTKTNVPTQITAEKEALQEKAPLSF